MQGRWNVRLPGDLGAGAGDSRLVVRVEVLGDMGVVHNMAGSLLWLHCGLGTTADAATAGLSVKSSLKHKNLVHLVWLRSTNVHLI